MEKTQRERTGDNFGSSCPPTDSQAARSASDQLSYPVSKAYRDVIRSINCTSCTVSIVHCPRCLESLDCRKWQSRVGLAYVIRVEGNPGAERISLFLPSVFVDYRSSGPFAAVAHRDTAHRPCRILLP